jgi:CO/xanthine dehydrogenase Mo-binding subunit
MTEILDKELSRKSFLKGTGALVVGFSLAGAGLAGRASAAASPDGYLPDDTQVDSWLKITPDNKAMLMTSEVEVGQGTTTGFLMVVADELDMDMSQVLYGSSIKDRAGNQAISRTDTWIVLSTGGIGGSQSTVRTSPKIRAAAVAARKKLLELASAHLNVPVANLFVSKGVVTGNGRSVSYGELVGNKLFNVKITTPHLNPGEAPAKPLNQLKLVGTRVPRVDLPAKITGSFVYTSGVNLPGMLHGRWVRRGQGSYGTAGFAKPLAVDRSSIANLKNVRVIHEGDFVGVVGPNEWEVIQAAQKLKVTWTDSGILPGHASLWKHYRDMDTAGKIPARITAQGGDFDAALKAATKTVSASFQYPYNGHIVIGPACFLADYVHAGGPDKDRVTIISNTQNVQNSVTDLQEFLGLKSPKQVRQIYYEGSSSFGNGYPYFDIAEAAALMSRSVGKPVRLQLMRWDEQGWMKNGPAIMTDIRAGIDAKGFMTAFEATQFVPVGSRVAGATRAMLGEAQEASSSAGTNTENLAPMYRVAQTASGTSQTRHITSETQTKPSPGMGSAFPGITPLQGVSGYRLIAKSITPEVGIFQTGPLRAPSGPQTAFASEQVIDMLAEQARMDPFTFRVQNMRTDTFGEDWEGSRWVGVLTAAVDAAKAGGYVPHVPASSLQSGNVVTGWGIAIGTHHEPYAATVAKVTVNKKTGKITVNHLWGSQDSGFAVNPGLLENQMVGNLIQATSKVLHEELRFDRNRVTSTDWVTYPILRFVDAPTVTPIVVNRRDRPPIGAGEPPIVPTGAAIANAVYDATGVRMTQAPLIPARVRGFLRNAGRA